MAVKILLGRHVAASSRHLLATPRILNEGSCGNASVGFRL